MRCSRSCRPSRAAERRTVRTRPLLAVLVLSCLTLTALDAGDRSPFDPLRTAVDTVLGPVHAAVGGAASSVGDAVSAVGDLADRSELEGLREQNARLRRQLAAGQADQRRLDELDALLGLPEAPASVPARVVAVGSALGFSRTVTVDVGSEDGVREGQTVLSGAGLVGRTVRVGPWTTVVLLLDDPGFGVGARLAREGTLGLTRGAGNGRLEYTQVEGGTVEVGDAVLTAGSDTFVAGVPIGRVTAVRTTAGGLTAAAEVDPLVDPSALELVAVVTEPARARPRQPLS
jgi:rod shape-determining protein MreC